MKQALITHIADPDGAFPIVLANLVLDDITSYSVDVLEVDETLKKIIDDYDHIYIVDLCMSDLMAEYIYENNITKIEVYDHHESRSHLNKYSFIHEIDERNNRKECGSTLFYEHLTKITNNEILNKESLKKMLELVRMEDTFDFNETDKDLAFDFAKLYDIYGRDRFITNITKFIKENDTFYFTDIDKVLLEIEKEKENKYVKDKLSHMLKATIDGVKVGIVFAEKNRSIIGNKMCELNEDIDVSIVVNVDRSFSYRSKKDVDTTKLSCKYGGGGHFHASGSPLKDDLQKHIIEESFENVIWEETCK